MKWFMSYVQVYHDGRFQFGHSTYNTDEHPIAKAVRWGAEYGVKDGFKVVVLSFQQVADDCPESDVLSHGIS